MMDLAGIANAVNAVAVTAGVVFSATQLRDYRRQRRSDAMLELVRSFQSPAFTWALRRINSLPDGARLPEIRERLGPDGEDDLFLIGLTWESLGVLVFRREITLDLMDDFFSGAISISWRKLRLFVEEDRAVMGRPTVWEWFQWLAERMIEREQVTPPNPAHLVHKQWRG
ncbi:MAG: DUF4760 domain-containing protein [Polyangia bacterium]